MYDKELFNKIINVSCTFEELEAFVIDIVKKEFDLENAFDKYYSVETILKAIRRYENKEIDDRYLSYWMNAYDWIIMAGFKMESENKEIYFKDWLVWEISNLLDSLSFFDNTEDWYNLEDYTTCFKILDKIYKNLNDWKCLFAHTDEWGDNEDDVVLLITNHKTKEFVKTYGNLDYLNEDVRIQKIELAELERQIENLNAQGFKKLDNKLAYCD